MSHRSAAGRNAATTISRRFTSLSTATSRTHSRRLNRAQSQNEDFIWIPESLLSDTTSRFFRLEGPCSSQKRHGSNVPGPLEARRRLAKRRMALASQGGLNEISPWIAWKQMLSWFLSGRWVTTSPPFPVKLDWEAPWALETKN